MLVLTRSREEKVVIQTPQGDVTITVLSIRGHSVRLGFEAPIPVTVHRAEILTEPRPTGTQRAWCSPLTRIDLDAPPQPEADEPHRT